MRISSNLWGTVTGTIFITDKGEGCYRFTLMWFFNIWRMRILGGLFLWTDINGCLNLHMRFIINRRNVWAAYPPPSQLSTTNLPLFKPVMMHVSHGRMIWYTHTAFTSMQDNAQCHHCHCDGSSCGSSCNLSLQHIQVIFTALPVNLPHSTLGWTDHEQWRMCDVVEMRCNAEWCYMQPPQGNGKIYSTVWNTLVWILHLQYGPTWHLLWCMHCCWKATQPSFRTVPNLLCICFWWTLPEKLSRTTSQRFPQDGHSQLIWHWKRSSK